MNLQLTDGYVINPYIIWGELDYRGFAAIGLSPNNNFNDLNFLKEIKSRCQYIRCQDLDFLFVSCPLADFSPDTSVFNLNDSGLKQFYKKTYESAQEEMLRTFYRIKHLSGEVVSPMNEEDLSYLWSRHFNPLENRLDIDCFNTAETILTNSLPECNINESAIGFKLNGCIHHFIQVKSKQAFSEIVPFLDSYSFSISLNEHGSETLIHLHADNCDEITRQAKEIKAQLHSLPETDYYEANDSRENLKFFERSVPGWCFGGAKATSNEVCPA